ncbi:MAG: methyltransferase type 12 [Blastopirellula sp.]|nr:MAG: methyltransferase type 12 [Blastopirellula sp.]
MNQPTNEEMLGQFIPLHYHYDMLRDGYRMETFRLAIESMVTPGIQVVDLGGGTGVLSFFAAKQGANVTYVERNPQLVEVARKLFKLNGVEDRIQVVQADAKDFVPECPVELVTCEMLHVGLLREKQVEVIAAFKQNYLQKHNTKLPRFIPEASLLACQPVTQEYEFEGFLAPGPIFQRPANEHDETICLSEPVVYDTVWYDKQLPNRLGWEGTMTIEQDGSLNGIRFVTKNVLSFLLQEHRAIEWHNQFMVMPLDLPIPVKKGQQIRLAFNYQPGDELPVLDSSLQVELLADADSAQKQSTSAA